MVFAFVFSYDTWLSAGEVDGDVEEPPSADRPWKVSSRTAQNKYSPYRDEEDSLADPRSVPLRFTPSGC